MSASAVVSGWELFRIELTSPLILGIVTVVVVAAAVRARLATRRGRGAARLARVALALALAAAVAVPVMVAYGVVDPTLDYGVWVGDGWVAVRFYRHDAVNVSICEITRAELVGVDEALDMLELRLNGLSDPATGLRLGYFEATGGREAAVIIMAKHAGKVLVLETRDHMVLVGVPGVEEAYRAIVEGLGSCQ